jgi:hypothetical protein
VTHITGLTLKLAASRRTVFTEPFLRSNRNENGLAERYTGKFVTETNQLEAQLRPYGSSTTLPSTPPLAKLSSAARPPDNG